MIKDNNQGNNTFHGLNLIPEPTAQSAVPGVIIPLGRKRSQRSIITDLKNTANNRSVKFLTGALNRSGSKVLFDLKILKKHD